HETGRKPDSPSGRFEEGACRSGVATLASAAHAPSRVVQLSSARLADARQDAVGAKGQFFPQTLLEHGGHVSREAEEDESGPTRASGRGRFEDPCDVLVTE